MLDKRFFKTKDEVEVTFQLSRPGAEKAALLLEQNGWEPIPMRRVKLGLFRAKVRLPKDRSIQFRYLLDGERWENDEAADEYWPNGFGSDNSVVRTA